MGKRMVPGSNWFKFLKMLIETEEASKTWKSHRQAFKEKLCLFTKPVQGATGPGCSGGGGKAK